MRFHNKHVNSYFPHFFTNLIFVFIPPTILSLCQNRLYGIFETRCVQSSKVLLTFEDKSSREVIITMPRSMLGRPFCSVDMDNLKFSISIIL